jgi:hypothetical protein
VCDVTNDAIDVKSHDVEFSNAGNNKTVRNSVDENQPCSPSLRNRIFSDVHRAVFASACPSQHLED